MLFQNDTMKLYMQNIGQYDLITREEEKKLAAEIKAGSEEARNKLIKSNLRLVVKIAHDFKGRGLPLLDLVSEGNIGLMRAVEKFDPSKGAKLSSYSAWWIKQSMRRALANQARIIRIPVQAANKIGKIKSTEDKLRKKLNRDPTDAEIAEEIKNRDVSKVAQDMTARSVSGLRQVKNTTISLNAPIKTGEDGTIEELVADTQVITPDKELETSELLVYLLSLMEELDDRERLILNMRFGLDGQDPKTLEETSQAIGRTRERVRQIQNQALEKLRILIEEDGKPYYAPPPKQPIQTPPSQTTTKAYAPILNRKIWRKKAEYIFLTEGEKRVLQVLNTRRRAMNDSEMSLEIGSDINYARRTRLAVRAKLTTFIRFQRNFQAGRKYELFDDERQTLLYAILSTIDNSEVANYIRDLEDEQQRDVLNKLYKLNHQHLRKNHAYIARERRINELEVQNLEYEGLRKLAEIVGLNPDEILEGTPQPRRITTSMEAIIPKLDPIPTTRTEREVALQEILELYNC